MASFKRKLSTLNQRRSFSEDLSEFSQVPAFLGRISPTLIPCASSGIVPGTALPAAVSALEGGQRPPRQFIFQPHPPHFSDSQMGGFSTMDRPSDCLLAPAE